MVGIFTNKKNLFLLSVAVLGIFLCYSNVLHGEFLFDDYSIVSHTGRLLQNPFMILRQGLLRVLSSASRPLPAFTFYLNYLIGGPDVFWFHLTNILLHLITVVLIYVFIKRLLSTPLLRETFGSRREIVALVIASIWGIHPLQTQAVSYITQRSEIMASFFYIASLLLLDRALAGRGGRSILYYCCAVAVFLSGWLSKVIIATMPLTFLLYAAFFHERVKLRKAILMVIPLFLGAGVFGVMIVTGFSETSTAGFRMESIGQPEYFYTQLPVFLTYIRLIFLPAGQNLDHDYPVYHTPWNPQVLLSCLVISGLILFSLYTLRRKHSLLRISGFGILWFFVLLLPTSSLVPLMDVINEHRVYLAMLGLILPAVIIFDRVVSDRNLKIVIPLLVMLVLGITTYRRNFVWQSELNLWQDVVRKSPRKARGHNNLGNVFLKRREYQTALQEFLAAIQYDPDNMLTAYYNAGLTLDLMGRYEEAKRYYQEFVSRVQKKRAKLRKPDAPAGRN